MRVEPLRTMKVTRMCALLALALLGCATAPQEQFFTLGLATPAPQSAAATAEPAFSIIVGPVTVPDVVDRPQFVLQPTPNRVEIEEQARWASPLKSEIARVIAEELARRLGGARTATSSQHATGTPDYRVLVDVQRFDSVPQQGVTIQALWTVTGKDGMHLTGRSLATEPAGAGYEALVAAHSRALATISREIAAAIAAARTSRT